LAHRRKKDNVKTAISTLNLTKHFARTAGYRDLLPFRKKKYITALENVSLEIKEGELFGLLGPNGAGKTTLIKHLCCLILPTSGTARIFGHDTGKEEQAIKQMVGLVSAEERSFYWRLTGRENLQFFASMYHLSRQQTKNRINDLFELIGMSDKADIRFQNYSTGMRQKLAIARGLLSEPRILFVDEPTRSLDPVSAQAVRHFIKEKVDRDGMTVILATHNLYEAEQLCDRLAIMDHGRVIASGSVDELRALFLPNEGCELQVRQFSDSLVQHLREIEGVQDCQQNGQQDGVYNLKFRLTDRAKVLPQILATLVNSGAEVCNCQLHELPLEELFEQVLHSGEKGKN
jgi:ABC-2 type transport system ATP-binding protein